MVKYHKIRCPQNDMITLQHLGDLSFSPDSPAMAGSPGTPDSLGGMWHRTSRDVRTRMRVWVLFLLLLLLFYSYFDFFIQKNINNVIQIIIKIIRTARTDMLADLLTKLKYHEKPGTRGL